MQACGLAPNLVSYGICMDACAKAGLWEKVSRAQDVLLLPHVLCCYLENWSGGVYPQSSPGDAATPPSVRSGAPGRSFCL